MRPRAALTHGDGMITFLKWLGIAASVGLIGLAAFLAHTPWRVHGGRFVTEYMLLAAPCALIGAVILVLSLRAGG
jgi:hypothetical protein